VSTHDILNQVLIIWTCFIRARKSTIYQLKLPTFDQLLDFFFLDIALIVPPHLEIFDFNLTKLPIGILKKRFYHIADSLINICNLHAIIKSIEIVTDGF